MLKPDEPTVSVIIPTRGERTRVALLQRAIDSVVTQEGVRAVPVVVINGGAADAGVISALEADARLRVVTLAEADLPAAIRAGRCLVDTPYFSELDDDDVLLPGALALRVAVLTERTDCDVVVTNGIRRAFAGDALHVADMAAVERDPLAAFLERNWLLPGSWLCRTDRVGAELFDDMPRFRECTYLALRFATDCRTAFVSAPTLVYDSTTLHSESKSREYVLGGLAASRRLLELNLPPHVRARLRKRLVGHFVSIAHLHRREGRWLSACAWYLRASVQPGAPRFVAKRLRRIAGA
jgi:glycosyltransferase involved in cell wall biosynthesis